MLCCTSAQSEELLCQLLSESYPGYRMHQQDTTEPKEKREGREREREVGREGEEEREREREREREAETKRE